MLVKAQFHHQFGIDLSWVLVQVETQTLVQAQATVLKVVILDLVMVVEEEQVDLVMDQILEREVQQDLLEIHAVVLLLLDIHTPLQKVSTSPDNFINKSKTILVFNVLCQHHFYGMIQNYQKIYVI
jgi:hypothetical protein